MLTSDAIRLTWNTLRTLNAQNNVWAWDVLRFPCEIITARTHRIISSCPRNTEQANSPLGNPLVPLENTKYASVSRFAGVTPAGWTPFFFVRLISRCRETSPSRAFAPPPSRIVIPIPVNPASLSAFFTTATEVGPTTRWVTRASLSWCTSSGAVECELSSAKGIVDCSEAKTIMG